MVVLPWGPASFPKDRPAFVDRHTYTAERAAWGPKRAVALATGWVRVPAARN